MKANQGLDFHRMIGAAAPLWLWIFTTVCVGGFVLLVMYMEQHKTALPQDKMTISKNSQPKKPVKSAKGEAEAESTKFDFYKLLPELESIVPDKDIALLTKRIPAIPIPPTASPEKTGGKSVEYYLQAGSFKQHNAADRMKANLALMGIESAIFRVNLGATGAWYRVRMGPFEDATKIQKIKGRLQANNIQPILVKVKG